jgi:hypothetical protein
VVEGCASSSVSADCFPLASSSKPAAETSRSHIASDSASGGRSTEAERVRSSGPRGESHHRARNFLSRAGHRRAGRAATHRPGSTRSPPRCCTAASQVAGFNDTPRSSPCLTGRGLVTIARRTQLSLRASSGRPAKVCCFEPKCSLALTRAGSWSGAQTVDAMGPPVLAR